MSQILSLLCWFTVTLQLPWNFPCKVPDKLPVGILLYQLLHSRLEVRNPVQFSSIVMHGIIGCTCWRERVRCPTNFNNSMLKLMIRKLFPLLCLFRDEAGENVWEKIMSVMAHQAQWWGRTAFSLKNLLHTNHGKKVSLRIDQTIIEYCPYQSGFQCILILILGSSYPLCWWCN